MHNAPPAVFQVMRQIVKQGKQVLRDHYVSREKVPTFARRYSSKKIQQSIVQDGNQSEVKRRYSHFSLKVEQPPQTILKDNMAKHSTKFTQGMKKVQQDQVKSPDRSKTTNNRFYSSRKKNEKRDSPRKLIEEKQNPQMRQNTFLKLQEDHGNRKVAERARKREQERQDAMREQKRQMMMWQYQEKLQNEAFLKDRENRYIEKEKMLADHLKRGKQFNYGYDSSGDLLLFETNDRRNQKYPPQTVYKVANDNEEEFTEDYEDKNADLRRQQSLGYKRPSQNQRIRSARGEAFASAVLRTVNMSKMSMNGSVVEVDPEQFMKRNDLFNNNHCRQTTNIPFLQPKVGTVYTEIATNQIATNKHSPSTAANYQDDASVESRQRDRKFEAFRKQERMSKTARDITKEEELEEAVRPIRSSQEGQRRGSATERRPYTSSTQRNARGKITASNYHLVQSLLQ